MIFFFYGPDDYRAKNKILELKTKFNKDVDFTDSGLVELSGDKWSFENWHDLTGANSLFARRRLIVIEDLFKRDKALIELMIADLKNIGENILAIYESDLVFDAKKNKFFMLDKEGKEKALTQIQEKLREALRSADYQQYYESLVGSQLNTWIISQFAEKDVKISTPALQYLSQHFKGNLWALNNEIDKLSAYAKGGGSANAPVIGIEDINALTGLSVEQNIFSLVDAICNKNKQQALKMIEEQLKAGVAEAYLLTMLSRQFKALAQARSLLDQGADQRTIVAKLKMHPFVAQKAINQARFFNSQALAQIISELVKIDFKYKTGNPNFNLLIDKLIIDI